MPVTCMICNKEFGKMITNSHAKSHNLTTAEYKEKFGKDSMSCPEYRALRSSESAGENNRNYGKKLSDDAKKRISDANKGSSRTLAPRTNEHSKKISNAAIIRWSNPEFKEQHSGFALSNETKEKISSALVGRRRSSTSTAKSIATRKINFPLGSKKGKYSPSEVTKAKTAECLAKAREKRKLASLEKRHSLAARLDAQLLSSPDCEYVQFKCGSCGNIFSRTPQFLTESKFSQEACRVCNPRKKGLAQARLQADIQAVLGRSLLSNDRVILGGKELDIVDPISKVAVEYCGLYWHADDKDDNKNKHLLKAQMAEQKGYKLITVFEDEYLDRPDVVVTKIASAMGAANQKIFARKCELVELPSKEANEFLNKYHLQGSGRSTVRYGLKFDNELVSVMTFSKSNISRGNSDWEINRFASKIGVVVVGGASKMFSKFKEDQKAEKVISYSDNRWGDGAVYGALGFTLESLGVPNYWYIDGASRIHRYSLRKNESDDASLTEWENRFNAGWLRIWDCGHRKWVYSIS